MKNCRCFLMISMKDTVLNFKACLWRAGNVIRFFDLCNNSMKLGSICHSGEIDLGKLLFHAEHSVCGRGNIRMALQFDQVDHEVVGYRHLVPSPIVERF